VKLSLKFQKKWDISNPQRKVELVKAIILGLLNTVSFERLYVHGLVSHSFCNTRGCLFPSVSLKLKG
jgi:hypothetical protein